MDSLDEFEIESIKAGERPFDDVEWFGRDLAGHIGVFATAGFAAIPLLALDLESGFNTLHQQVKSLRAGRGSKAIDESQGMNPSFVFYADRGLFVYDWNHAAGQYEPKLPYRIMTVPLSPINEGALISGKQLPLLPFHFSEVSDIAVESYFEELNL